MLFLVDFSDVRPLTSAFADVVTSDDAFAGDNDDDDDVTCCSCWWWWRFARTNSSLCTASALYCFMTSGSDLAGETSSFDAVRLSVASSTAELVAASLDNNAPAPISSSFVAAPSAAAVREISRSVTPRALGVAARCCCGGGGGCCCCCCCAVIGPRSLPALVSLRVLKRGDGSFLRRADDDDDFFGGLQFFSAKSCRNSIGVKPIRSTLALAIASSLSLSPAAARSFASFTVLSPAADESTPPLTA